MGYSSELGFNCRSELLEKIVNDDAGNLAKRVALASFASKLAPTEVGILETYQMR
jgi:hypothetical protein